MNKEHAQALGSGCLLQLNRKMKQKDLAEALGVPQSYVSDLEAGKKLIPTDTLLGITEMFGIGLDYFDLKKASPVYPAQEQNQDIPPALENSLYKLEQKLYQLEDKLQFSGAKGR